MSYSLECVIMKWVNQLLPLNMEFLIKLTHTYNHTHYLSHGYNDSHLTQLSLNCCVNECTVRNSIWLTWLITLITLRFVGHVGWFPVHVSEWVSGLSGLSECWDSRVVKQQLVWCPAESRAISPTLSSPTGHLWNVPGQWVTTLVCPSLRFSLCV